MTNSPINSSSPAVPTGVQGFSKVPVGTAEFPLPSNGYAYRRNGTPRIPDGRVYIRPMTGREEAILNGPLTDSAKIDSIIGNCTTLPDGFHHRELLFTDRLVLLCAIRAISLGARYRVNVKCDSCRHEYTHDVDLIDREKGLQIEGLPRKKINKETGLEDGVYDFDPEQGIECVLPVSRNKVRLRLLTGADENFILTELQKGVNSKFIPPYVHTSKSDPSYYLRNTLCIKDIQSAEGNWREVRHHSPADAQEVANFVANLPIRDVQFIESTYTKYDVGIDKTFSTSCPHCAAENTAVFAMSPEFFRPTNFD